MTRPTFPTLVHALQHWASVQPDHMVCTFLEDGLTEAARVTFRDLDARARRVAKRLTASACPGDRVLVVYATGIDFVVAFMGCLYARMIAIPIPAPEASRLQRSLPRLEGVATDSGACLLLADTRTQEILAPHYALLPSLGPEHWIDPEDEGPSADTDPAPPEPGDIAYMQYTSGSTSNPKGVMVSHDNLVVNLAAIREASGYDPKSVTVTWMPHFHDYGLIEGHLMPVFNGTPVYLMSPYAFVKRPLRLLAAMSKYRATHTQAPNFAYGHCVRRISDVQVAELDLSHVRSMANAAEPINPRTQEEFIRKFAPAGFSHGAMSPAYGLAEATLIVSATPPGEAPCVHRFDGEILGEGRAVEAGVDASPGREIAGCGRPLAGVTVAIVDPDTRHRLPDGHIGEIWVTARSIAQGYWNRPEESRETFEAEISGESGVHYMRTGDLGFLMYGQIHVTSRLKDLIIIRGQNHYPQEIEWAVQSAHPGLRPGNSAAFSIEEEGEERLVVVQELQDDSPAGGFAEIVAAVATVVTETFDLALHGLALIERGTLAKTTSGKVRRRLTREAYLQGSLQAVHLWSASAEGDQAPLATARGIQAASPIEPKGAVLGQTALGSARAEPRRDSGTSRHDESREIRLALSRSRTDALLDWLRGYAETRIDSRLIDERRSLPPSVVLDFGNRGLFGLLAPERHGGLDLGFADTYRILEQLGAIDLTLATFVHLHNTNGTLPILRFAPQALQEELLPLLARGRELAAFALSEPGAGTHLGAISTRATAVGEHRWTLTGVKRWNATGWSAIISVFARMERPDGRPGALAGFVVRHGEPGVRLGPESLTMGMRGIMQNSLHLEQVPVDASRLLGRPGEGMRIAEDTLTEGRLAAAALALGGMKRCAQLALRYASRREIETGTLLDNPQANVRVSALLHRIAILEELVSVAGHLADDGRRPSPELAMTLKVSATDGLNYAADLLVQLLGGRGYMENNLAPQIFRDARMWSIGEGANEGLTAAVGRALRLAPELARSLREFGAGDETVGRLAGLVEPVGLRGATPNHAAPEAETAWRDAALGRLLGGALDLAAAERIASRPDGDSEVLAWARGRFEALRHEAESGSPDLSGALAGERIKKRIGALERSIGDLEPRTPGVDLEVDPLLRRSKPGTSPVNPAGGTEVDSPGSGRDVAPGVPGPEATLEEKRAFLRQLLRDEHR